MLNYFAITKKDFGLLLASVLMTLLAFAGFCANYACGESVSLTVSVTSSITFTSDGNVTFPGVAAGGTYQTATTTLSVTTNNAGGWNVTLYGEHRVTGNTVMDLSTDDSVGITDQKEWVPEAATSTLSTQAFVRGSLDNSGDVLAFRVMSASSTNGGPFLAPSWWGDTDADGTAKWAGIASTTVQRQIGNAGLGSYSADAHLNTVQYYLKVPISQQTGSYDGGLVYTATAN